MRGSVAVLPVVVVVVGDDPERLAAVTSRSIGFVNGHLCAIQHASTAHLVGMVVERSEESDTDFGEVFEVGIGDLAGCAVVFDQVLIVLVIGRRELREGTQILRGAGVRFQRTRSRAPGRILSAGARFGRLRRTDAHECQSHDRNRSETHGATLLIGYSDWRPTPEHCDGLNFDEEIGTAQNRLNSGGCRKRVEPLLFEEIGSLFVEGLIVALDIAQVASRADDVVPGGTF